MKTYLLNIYKPCKRQSIQNVLEDQNLKLLSQYSMIFQPKQFKRKNVLSICKIIIQISNRMQKITISRIR